QGLGLFAIPFGPRPLVTHEVLRFGRKTSPWPLHRRSLQGGSSRIANRVRLSSSRFHSSSRRLVRLLLWQPVRAPTWETPGCARMRPDGVRQAGCAPQALTAIAVLLVVVFLLLYGMATGLFMAAAVSELALPVVFGPVAKTTAP